jgi:hypothetical protein
VTKNLALIFDRAIEVIGNLSAAIEWIDKRSATLGASCVNSLCRRMAAIAFFFT